MDTHERQSHTSGKHDINDHCSPDHDNRNEPPSTIQVTVIPYAFSSVIKQLQAVQALEAKGLIVVVINRLTIIKRGDGKNRSKLWNSQKIEAA